MYVALNTCLPPPPPPHPSLTFPGRPAQGRHTGPPRHGEGPLSATSPRGHLLPAQGDCAAQHRGPGSLCPSQQTGRRAGRPGAQDNVTGWTVRATDGRWATSPCRSLPLPRFLSRSRTSFSEDSHDRGLGPPAGGGFSPEVQGGVGVRAQGIQRPETRPLQSQCGPVSPGVSPGTCERGRGVRPRQARGGQRAGTREDPLGGLPRLRRPHAGPCGGREPPESLPAPSDPKPMCPTGSAPAGPEQEAPRGSGPARPGPQRRDHPAGGLRGLAGGPRRWQPGCQARDHPLLALSPTVTLPGPRKGASDEASTSALLGLPGERRLSPATAPRHLSPRPGPGSSASPGRGAPSPSQPQPRAPSSLLMPRGVP